MADSYDHKLQIIFGAVGVLSTLLTLAGLHNRESLGCILFRRVFSRRHRFNAIDPEAPAFNPPPTPRNSDTNTCVSFPTPSARTPTLPPSYASSLCDPTPPPTKTKPSHAASAAQAQTREVVGGAGPSVDLATRLVHGVLPLDAAVAQKWWNGMECMRV